MSSELRVKRAEQMKKVFEPEVLYESVLKQKSFRFSIRIAKFLKYYYRGI